MRRGRTLATRMDKKTSRFRIERLLYSSVGFAALVYGFLLFPGKKGIQGQTPQLESWYGYGLILVAVLLPFALGIVAWIVPGRWVNRLAGATAILFLIAMMLFPLGLPTATLADNLPPWYQGIHALHGMIAAIVWQRKEVWLYAIAQGIVIGIVQNAVRENSSESAFLTGVGSFVFIAILMGVTVAIMNAADRLDAASAQARLQAAQTAESRTKQREETRINAMVHDDIMSVLLTASRDNPPPALKHQARVALEAIDALEAPVTTDRTYTVREAVHALLDVVARWAPAAHVNQQVDGGTEVPAEVVTALCDALAEALRNSVRHAGVEGAEVKRRVDIDARENGISVFLTDDGKGFNTKAVASRRLGVRLSILERMGLVPGGSADIRSKSGEGTTVSLLWERAA